MMVVVQAAAGDVSNPIQIRASLGFSDTFRLGYWAPLSVSISNEGSDIVGDLDVQVMYGEELADTLHPKIHRRRLDLSKGSRKRFQFTVYLESFAHPLVIRITSGGRELARHSIELRRRFTEGRLILVLSRDANLDYLNDGTGDSLRVLYPHPELLPDHWQGYDSITAMIVHGISLEELSTRQFDALKKWVAHGGRLAVSGGSDYSLLRTPRLAQLLPASPVGLVQITDSSRLGDALGAPLETQSPFHIQRLSNVRGNVLYEFDGLPLVVQEFNGKGRVTYLSFDVGNYPFDQWREMKRFWFATLGVVPSLRQTFQKREVRHVSPVPAIINRRAGGFPGHQIVLVFIVLYLGILATAYRLRPSNNAGLRTRSAVILACPFLFAPVAYFIFGPLLFPFGPTAVIVSVIEPFERGSYAALNMDLGLFSTRRQKFSLELESGAPGLVSNDREERWGKARGFTVSEGSGLAIEPAYDQPYVLHLLQGADVITYDVSASVITRGTDVQLSVRNDTGHSWRDVWLVFEQNLYRFGRVEHNEGAEVVHGAHTVVGKLTAETWKSALDTAEPKAPLERHMTELLLKRAFNEYLLHAPFGSEKALLLATAPSPIRLAQNNSSWRREELALVRMEIDVSEISQTNVSN